MWRFLFRFRFILLIFRFLIVPAFTFLLAFLVLFIMAGSIYTLAIAKTIRNIVENPYIFVPLLVMEISLMLIVTYTVVVYTNKIRKHILRKLEVNDEKDSHSSGS